MADESNVRILAAGTRFFPYPHPGDKTFWLHLLRAFANAGHEIHVINVDRRARPLERLDPGMTFETLPAVPVFFRAGPQAHRYNRESLEIGAITNYGSKTLTLPHLIRRVEQVRERWSADVVHLVDNLGPAAWPFVRRMTGPTFTTAITYDPRYVLYDSFLFASLSAFTRVAASSDTFRDRLLDVGLDSERVRTIRWGADPQEHAPSSGQAEAKHLLGVPADHAVAFWSGYIQQITEQDFQAAYAIARAARDRAKTLEVFFCFKPAHFRPSFRALELPGIHIRGDRALDFDQVREAADIMLSPVTRSDSILAPPLTWVESMLRGIPILTTPCGAAGETIPSGRAGEVVPMDRLAARAADLARDPSQLSRLRSSTRAWAVERYALQQSVKGYQLLWNAS